MKNLNQNELKFISGGMTHDEAKSLIGLGAIAGALQLGGQAITQTMDLGYFAKAGHVADGIVVGAFVGAISSTLLGMLINSSSNYYNATHDSNIEHIHVMT